MDVIKRSITFSWKREFTWNCLKSCRILFADNSSTVKLKTCTHRSNELLQLFRFNRLVLHMDTGIVVITSSNSYGNSY